MNARALIGAGLVLSCGLSRAAPDSSDGSDEPDGGSTERRGEVGSHVWFDTSQSIELRETWLYDTRGGDAAPNSGCTSVPLDRSTLSARQLTTLENLVLVPLTDACTADGYVFHQLTVVDRDPLESVYRDTGCSYLRVEGALAMLPPNFFDSMRPLPPASPCPP